MLPVLTQIGVVLGLGFIVELRSGYGFDYMLFALMRGYDRGHLFPPCYQASDLNLQGYHFTIQFKPLQLASKQTTPTVFETKI